MNSVFAKGKSRVFEKKKVAFVAKKKVPKKKEKIVIVSKDGQILKGAKIMRISS
jgi:hypothetical protein